MSFAAAQANFLAGRPARHRRAAVLARLRRRRRRDDLVLRQLLPMADEGLRRWGVADRGHVNGISA